MLSPRDHAGKPLDPTTSRSTRLARNLDIAADVTRARVSGAQGQQLAVALMAGAAFLSSRDTFLH